MSTPTSKNATKYYLLMEPFTNIVVTKKGERDFVTLYIGAKSCGTMALPKGLGHTVAIVFSDWNDSCVPAQSQYSQKRGILVNLDVNFSKLHDDTCLVSEHGVPITLGELRR